ncbi:MAG: hypothetical protein Q7S99_14690 [Parvibaculum sp.]|nr:hypothetical protein [Parvibaculum sp.]
MTNSKKTFCPKTNRTIWFHSITPIALALTIFISSATMAAGVRISTGKDLYEACKVLSEFGLNPQGPTPRQGLYCRQFIAGYFSSIKYTAGDETADPVAALPNPDRDCISFTGPRTYEQLAGKVVRSAEWRPELLGLPAVELVRAAFGGLPECPARTDYNER